MRITTDQVSNSQATNTTDYAKISQAMRITTDHVSNFTDNDDLYRLC